MVAAPFFGFGSIQLPAQRSCATIDDRCKVFADCWTSSGPVPNLPGFFQNLLEEVAVLHSDPPVFRRHSIAFLVKYAMRPGTSISETTTASSTAMRSGIRTREHR